MSETPQRLRPLPVLRAKLDAIDHDVLHLLAGRMAVVAEIAKWKREHGIAIRDLERERGLLRDRRQRASKLGLSPGVIESIFRQLLLASRDRQASLRTELPMEVESQTVAVIGGKGGMGTCMARLFGDLGHAVIVADLDTELTAVKAAQVADVVVISVPIRETEKVIREVGPHVSEDSLLMDVTSLKGMPVEVMLQSTKASVVGTHPMFGPGVNTLQGQRVVVCPGRGDTWLAWVRDMLRARGLVLTDSTPEEHDHVMSAVQVLQHFQTEVLGLSLSRLGVTLEHTLRFNSPAYLLEAYVTARHFSQSPALYGPIEMLNPMLSKVTDTFRGAATELADILGSADQVRFDQMFDEVQGFFGGFIREAEEQSGFLIDRLVELTAGRDPEQ